MTSGIVQCATQACRVNVHALTFIDANYTHNY